MSNDSTIQQITCECGRVITEEQIEHHEAVWTSGTNDIDCFWTCPECINDMEVE